MTKLGYQIPNFTYPGVAADQIFDNLVTQAKTAEAAGFDRIFLMDHFYQLPGIGDPDDYMLECYTTLAALAQHTDKVRLSALVTGNTYRNPAVLAKIITALDHVSHGRASLGIGSGWFELEHDAYGIPFNTFSERFEKLEEALNIILPMLRGERPTLHGEHYHVTEAINSPAPVSKIPVMIGGNGEKKTLRMVAQYALLYGVYMVAMIIAGFGMYFGLFAGSDDFALTILPAMFGMAVLTVALGFTLIPGQIDRRLALAGGSSRARSGLGPQRRSTRAPGR